jgi:hypothetical protein
MFDMNLSCSKTLVIPMKFVVLFCRLGIEEQ